MSISHCVGNVIYLRRVSATRPSASWSCSCAADVAMRFFRAHTATRRLATAAYLLPLLGLLTLARMHNSQAAPWPPDENKLSGAVEGASSAGIVIATCESGGGHHRVSSLTGWRFTIDLDAASGACLLDWRSDDGQRMLALTGRATVGSGQTQPAVISASSHLWVTYLRHVPLFPVGAATSFSEWFAQPQVHALLKNAQALEELRKNHFEPALICLLPRSTGAAVHAPHALEESLLRSQSLDSQRHPSVRTTAVLVRAAMRSDSRNIPSCQQLIQADYAYETQVPH